MNEQISEIEHLYSPSRWNKKHKNPEECIQKHIEFIEEKSEIVRRTIPGNYDVPYGPEKQKYDLIGTDLPNSAPIFFFIHGGYWQEEALNKQNYSFVASELHKNGIKTFMAGYDLCPKVTMFDIIKEIQEVFKICVEYANSVGCRGIYVSGHSAGGHLAMILCSSPCLQDNNLLKAAFPIAGVFDLTPLLGTYINTPLNLTTQNVQQFSPQKLEIKNKDIETFIIAGSDDSPAFVEQSKNYNEKLIQEKIKSHFVLMENIDHFDIISGLYDCDYKLTKLIVNFILEKNK